MRLIRSNREVLLHAVNDGINSFVRDVLIARGFLTEDLYEQIAGELIDERNAIAARVADHWSECHLEAEDEASNGAD
jgi:hypothetical protein